MSEKAILPIARQVMSAAALREMRLQQLREEFEAAAAKSSHFLMDVLKLEEWPTQTADEVAALSASLTVHPGTPAFHARRYIIARDFNEFDPQRADMLWKLQNGGAV